MKVENNEETEKINNNEIIINSKEYKILKVLGSGAYGEVYEVEDSSGNKYAIKQMKIIKGIQSIRFDMLREPNYLHCGQNEHLVNLYETTIINPYQVVLLMEFCDLDLGLFIEKYKHNPLIYNEETIKKISYQLIKGVEFLHSHLLMHRDLKPQNILLNFPEKNNEGNIINFNNFIVKIGDLGLSRKYSMLKRKYTPGVGTLYYRAPEIILGSEQYFNNIDTWSIGCIIAELILKRPLFIGNNDKTLLIEMCKIYGTFNDEILPGLAFFPKYKAFPQYEAIGLINYLKDNKLVDVSDDCFNLIKDMLVLDSTKRIQLEEALESNWFRNLN